LSSRRRHRTGRRTDAARCGRVRAGGHMRIRVATPGLVDPGGAFSVVAGFR
jgi:hypothetical protein